MIKFPVLVVRGKFGTLRVELVNYPLVEHFFADPDLKLSNAGHYLNQYQQCGR